ncbi:MAG: aminotransferase DegT [bacterium]|nr:MAG: aminotransferase DegT [bacterium]
MRVSNLLFIRLPTKDYTKKDWNITTPKARLLGCMKKLVKKPIPMLDLAPQNAPIAGETLNVFKKVIRSNHFILGKTVADFEEAARKFCGARYAVGVSSGTDALLVSMTALGVGQGDIVITPAFTFLPTAGCATRLGAVVKFIDVKEDSFNMDPQKLADFLKKNRSPRNRRHRVKAVLPVHLFGQCADMKPIMETCRRYGIAVIEDAAQAFGAQCQPLRKIAGTMGDMGCLSFYPTKNLGGVGDAGMILVRSGRLAKKIKMVRNHGQAKRYVHETVGGNFRIDALQAAALGVKLKILKKLDNMRVENARIYRMEFDRYGLVESGSVKLPQAAHNPNLTPSNRTHIFNQYSILVKRRDRLRKYLQDAGVSTEIFYPVPLHLQPCYKSLGYKKGDFPVAEILSMRVLSLPIYPGLKPGQIKRVVGRIAEFYTGLNI